MHYQGEQGEAEDNLSVDESTLMRYVLVGELDSIGDTGGKRERELEKADNEAKQRDEGLLELGVDGGLERARVDKVRLEVRRRRHFWGSITRRRSVRL
jgi:hypothetical protein